MPRGKAVPRCSRGRTWTRGAVTCIALAVVCGATRAEELVITSADFPVEVGTRTTIAISSAAGQPVGQVKLAVIGRRALGKTTLFREAVTFGPMRVRDSWFSRSDEEYASYSSFGAEHPSWKCRLPLKAGSTYEYRSDSGPARVRVEGPEEIEVPAGKFKCLVCVEERREADGARREQKTWVAPGVGFVKLVVTGERGFALSQVSVEKPRVVETPEGVEVISTFDVGDPLGSPLFPKAAWSGRYGLPGRVSDLDIETSGGAADTPFCLRWTYHTKGTWVSAYMEPSGSGSEPVDFSRYESMSFYIKGLTEGECAVSIRAKAAGGDQVIMVHIPVQVTTKWKKIEIGEGTPQLEAIDASQIYFFSLGVYDEGEASNVIWVDEVMLHRAGQAKPGRTDPTGPDPTEPDQAF